MPKFVSTYLLIACMLGWLGNVCNPFVMFSSIRWPAIGVLGLYLIVCTKGNAWERHPKVAQLSGMAAIYIGVMFIASLTSVFPEFSLAKLATFAGLVLPLFLFARTRLQPAEAREWVFYTAITLAITSPIVALTPYEYYGEFGEREMFFQGSAGDANTMGHLAAAGILSLVFLQYMLPPRNDIRLILYTLLIVSVITLLATKARSSAFSVLVGLAISLRYLPNLRRAFLVTSLLSAIVLLGLTSAQLNLLKEYLFKHQFAGKQNEMVDAFSGRSMEPELNESDDLSVLMKIISSRLPEWQRAWNAFLERPILGWGFGASALTDPRRSFNAYSIGLAAEVNNDLMATLESLGLIGCITHFSLILTILIAEAPPAGSRDTYWVFSYVLACSMWAGFMLDGNSQSIGYFTGALFWLSLMWTSCRPMRIQPKPQAMVPQRPQESVGKPIPRSQPISTPFIQ